MHILFIVHFHAVWEQLRSVLQITAVKTNDQSRLKVRVTVDSRF